MSTKNHPPSGLILVACASCPAHLSHYPELPAEVIHLAQLLDLHTKSR